MKVFHTKIFLLLLTVCSEMNPSFSQARYRNILERRGPWEEQFHNWDISLKRFIRTYRKNICALSGMCQVGLSIPLCIGSLDKKSRWVMPVSIVNLINSCTTLIAIRSLFESEHALNDEYIMLPEELYDIKHFEVIQVPSAIQHGPCCGWYTVMNACAIQTLLSLNKELSQYAIEFEVYKLVNHFERNLGKHHFKLLGIDKFFDGLSHANAHKLAQSLKLQSFYMVTPNGFNDLQYICQAQELPSIGFGSQVKNEQHFYSYWLSMTSFKQLLRFKKIGKHKIAHICLAIPSSLGAESHAVLLTIIKRQNEKSLIIYMDSNNYKLSSYEHSYSVSYFVTKFIYLLDKEGPIT